MEGALDHQTQAEGELRQTGLLAGPGAAAWGKLRGERRLGPVVYGALALVVAGPVLRPGLVLGLDLAQTPRSSLSPAYWGLPAGTNGGSPARLPLDALLALAGMLGGVQLFQKLLLAGTVFIAGLGMHRLVQARGSGRFFAGLVYAVNPFVCERLLAGQWFLLLGYSLIPWAYGAFLEGWKGQRWGPWRFAGLVGIVGFADPHMAVMVWVLCLTAVAVRLRRPASSQAPQLVVALGLGGAASLLWLMPTPGLHELFSHVGHPQLLLYGTLGDPRWGPALTVLGMGGFWDDPAPGFTALAVWPLFVVLFALLALRGTALLTDRRLAVAVAICGALGGVTALGTASDLTRPVEFWLMDHLAVLRSFRETDKAVVLLVFAYAFLGGPAVDELIAATRPRRLARPCAAALLLLPLVYGGRELWGGSGSLRPVSFPTSWATAERLLAASASRSRTLFLPFHGYLHLGFTGARVTYNPAPGYFSTPILAGRSVDSTPRHQDVSDPEQAEVSAWLARPGAADVGRCLASLGVSHILLAHEADWRRWQRLVVRTDMRVLRRWPDLTLLVLRHPGALAMTAPAGAPRRCPANLHALPARLEGPVRLRLLRAVPADRRLVLGLPDAPAWQRHGSEVVFGPWSQYRRVYLVGVAGWLVVAVSGLWVFVRRRWRTLRRTRTS